MTHTHKMAELFFLLFFMNRKRAYNDAILQGKTKLFQSDNKIRLIVRNDECKQITLDTLIDDLHLNDDDDAVGLSNIRKLILLPISA